MTATPALAARQMTIARADRAARGAQAAAIPRLAYVTTTGDAPRATRVEQGEQDSLGTFSPAWDPEPFCFVCGRCTDHVGEHDDMVESGDAEYAEHGTVYDRTMIILLKPSIR